MDYCTNFIQEENMLQINIRSIGGIFLHTPKYYFGIYSEGIKYSWGNSKY